MRIIKYGKRVEYEEEKRNETDMQEEQDKEEDKKRRGRGSELIIPKEAEESTK